MHLSIPCLALITTRAAAGAAVAQIPATRTYDGVYQGVSNRLVNWGGRRGCADAAPLPAPGPLTISNAVARTSFGNQALEGSVGAGGLLQMKTARSGFLAGRSTPMGSRPGRFLYP